jgi:hypothetical protein
MTSIAMSAGMLPSALGVGEGGSFRAPMAIAVIGGIIVSTVLSLVVVPAFFLILDDVSRLLGWLFSRFVGKKEEEEEPLTPEVLSFLARKNVQALEAMEKRVAAVERSQPVSRKSDGKGNVVNLPPLAAE